MKKLLLCCWLLPLCIVDAAVADEPTCRDLYSDTWVATDALGRTMPDLATVGPVKTDHRRVVGIFYITWHSDNLAKLKSPYAADVSRVLAADPKARLDAKNPLWTEGSYHWGQPELGYFLSKDRYVIRRDMSMLADAGVDVLIMDVTNGVCYWDEWEVVFSEMQKMKKEGNRVPSFCFWAFNGPVITVVQNLFDNIYKKGKYKDLWFTWDGKPLLLYNGSPAIDANGGGAKNPNPHYDAKAKTDPKHPHYGDPATTEEFYTAYTQDVKDFFTLRTMWWGYYEWAGKRFVGTEDDWSFGYDLGDERVKTLKPDQLVSRHRGVKEEAAVTPAQHPSSMIGKSWTRERGEPELNEFDLPARGYVPWLRKTVEHPEGYGVYFQQRWDEAIQADPQFLYINDWNEWTAGKYHPDPGHTVPFMRRAGTYSFVDQYNAEFNRAIQPTKGGYADNYYMQMAQNIRRYKGVRPIPVLRGLHRPTIDGRFDDWATIDVEYRDTIGDVVHRDYPGYGGQHYRDDSGRNDVIASKVAVDKENVYFYVQTNAPLTPHTDRHWMLLLIDADCNPSTGWNGYDFLVNERTLDDKTTTLLRYDPNSPGGPWIEQTGLSYRYAGNQLELAIPRQLLHLSGPAITFDFHWSDNPSDLKSLSSLRTTGDSAPNGRFNYRCIWNGNRSHPGATLRKR
jgi:hypothetical protein